MKIRINHNIKLNGLFKYNYLFFSSLLWFTPLHELGHVIICWFTGTEVTQINWWSSVHHIVTDWDWIHHVWEYSVFIPTICICIWCYLNYESFKKMVVIKLNEI